MNLWLLGVLCWLQAVLATLSSLFLHTPHPTLAGASLSLLLFGILPQGLRLCSPIVLAPALVLGIILSVFIKESLPPNLSNTFLWHIWLMIYTFLQANGTLPIYSILYFIPIAHSLPRLKATAILFSVLPLISFAAGCLWSAPAKWQGLLLSLACGMMLGCVSHHKTRNFAGGIALGVILSFL